MKSATSIRLFVAAGLAAVAAGPTAQAFTFNIASLETVLADPENTNDKMSALWTGWATQVYEYNMPFIELANPSPTFRSVSEFRLTLGDTNYRFDNTFLRKEDTNSYPYEANGEYAISGFSNRVSKQDPTELIPFTTRLEDGGDTLVVDFTARGGLKADEVVRFQVDISPDLGEDGKKKPGTSTFVPFTEALYPIHGRIDFVEDDGFLPFFLNAPPMSDAVAQFLRTPRPYQTMQMIDVHPDRDLGEIIPEPASALLLSLAASLGFARRRA